MLELNTKYHGVKKYSEDEVITFNKGLPGFEALRKFVIFPIEENEVFSILHSVEDESVGIIVMSPFDAVKDYEIDIDESIMKNLKIEKEADVMVINTVTINSKSDTLTTNLRAPIIINVNQKLGEQIILDNTDYLVKHPLRQG